MLFYLKLIAFVSTFGIIKSENEIVLRMCYEKDHRHRQLCECINESSPPWGVRVLRIDCSFRDLLSTDISDETLPLYTESIDLSWNKLQFVPSFTSVTLKRLTATHNNITSIDENNFAQLSRIQEIDLSWNAIQMISINAFSHLPFLTILDLSHNNIRKLNFNIFSNLGSLETLKLSWNRNLNNSEKITALELNSLYGITPKLLTLELEKCNLDNIHLTENVGLKNLNLRGNNFQQIPNISSNLIYLDLSENKMEHLRTPEKIRNLKSLETLLLEDLFTLKSIEANAFAGLDNLKILSFENSKRLTSFSQYAFGGADQPFPKIETFILRGTMIRTLNGTLLPLFQNLKEINMNGMPLTCDCDLLWLKDLKMETEARCFRPAKIRGMKVTSVNRSDFTCDYWPSWVYGLLILLLICLCSAGIWLIVMGLRPFTRVTMRSRVGAGSPYARVTIEPTRSENFY